MHPKQQEMDHVIETIYTIVADQDVTRSQTDPHAKGTLIVLCGDHGMNEVKNKGNMNVFRWTNPYCFSLGRQPWWILCE
jgi:ethanolaminephosphotransferase